MKIKSHDENGFPLDYNPSSYYKDPEIFVPLPPDLYNTNPGEYSVSTWGRIYNHRLNSFVPEIIIKDKNRYVITIIKDRDGKEVSVIMHRLIAELFVIPKPVLNKPLIVNHLDGIKWHNEPYNLDWTDQSGNTKHADQNNLIARPYGEDNGCSKLTDDQYREICRLTEQGHLPYQINKIMNLGFDITNICQKIRTGKSELLISSEYDFSNIPRNHYRKFSEEEVRTICLCLQDRPEIKPIEILQELGLDINNMSREQIKKYRDTISTIKRRVSYIEIGKDYSF